jgi:glycine dehydrogenase subunit 1
LQNTRYAMNLMHTIDGVNTLFDGAHFKEFIVNFDDTGKTVKQINKALLTRGIFGGLDLTAAFPGFGNSALYCVTEMHTRDDLVQLAEALEEVTK